MPDAKFTKPWHGVPRESIKWNPTIIEEACIGCGTCVTGCSRLVYRFDFDRKKPVVVDPLNCMVGCTTCANTCPAHAIAFPPIETVLAMEGLAKVRHAVEDELITRRDELAAFSSIPHQDRIVTLVVAQIEKLGANVLRLQLKPTKAGECFCEFIPGQYLELWESDASFMSRAYSIANVAEGDGTVELHIRKVEGGRFTDWAFSKMKVGDQVQARGPLGSFTMRSLPETSLLFIAGGTGLAPILALLRQQIHFNPQRNMILIWGAKQTEDFYALEDLNRLVGQAANLRIILAQETGQVQKSAERISIVQGNVLKALAHEPQLLTDRDIYAAGPPVMLRQLLLYLEQAGVRKDRIHVDSFGV